VSHASHRRDSLIASLVLVATLLASPRLAHAQTAIDGFDPNANDRVRAVVVQPGFSVIIGGNFTQVSGNNHHFIAQLNRFGDAGVFDTTFGCDNNVIAMARQSDGKILVGGDFTSLGGGGLGDTPRSHIGRFSSVGNLDTSFDPGADGSVTALGVQADGKILVGGSFSRLGGGASGVTTRHYIGRLNADGTIDASFDPGADGTVLAIALQPDGRILVGGAFTHLGVGAGTIARSHIGRLNPDGSVDASFDPGANADVISFAVQADHKIVAVGSFTMLGGGGTGTTTRNYIGRLSANGSLDASFDPGADGAVGALALQPDGKTVVGGTFTHLGGSTGTTPRGHIGRLNLDGSVDSAFDPGVAGGDVEVIAVQQIATGTDEKIIAGGTFTGLGGGSGATTRQHVGRLFADGTVEATFNPGADGVVYALALQADQKIVVGGAFSMLGDGATTARTNVGRLNPDGSVDTSFNPGANDVVYALAVQPDRKILVGGHFTKLGGGNGTTTRNFIGRFNPGGALDGTFDPGADNNVVAIAVQPDGKILVGGFFTMLAGVTRNHIGRLNSNGSLDMSFDPGANGVVNSIVLQQDGQILVGGSFTGLGNSTGTITRNRIGRLTSSGSVDMSFNPGASGTVNVITLLPDSRIAVGGAFAGLGGGTGTTMRNNIGILNPDGSLDTFNGGASGPVLSMVFDTDFELTVAGNFTGLGGGTGTTTRNRIGRFFPNGGVDFNYNPGANDIVYALAMQRDGRTVAGGLFAMLGGGSTGTAMRSHIGRLNGGFIGTQHLSASGSKIAWFRNGENPEIEWATFEYSSDGVSYTLLGNGTYDFLADDPNWHLDGLTLPLAQDGFVRARGYVASGQYDGSGSIDEFIANVFPSASFTDDPLTRTISVIRAVHITELRTRIDAVRAHYGLGPFPYADAITPGITKVRAQHILDLRTALAQAYAAAQLTPPTYSTTPAIGVIIVVKDIAELRAAVLAIE
jgi:uncharacterized delta-60 repeat protein